MTRFTKIAAASLLLLGSASGVALAGDGHKKMSWADRNDGQIPGLSHDPADVTGGTYAIDAGHTTVQWEVSHMGLSLFDGRFNKTSGTLTLDPKNLEASKLSITIDADSVDTTSDRLDDELRDAGGFNVDEFPTITFESTKIEKKDDKHAMVTGDLTFHGVTKPVTLKVMFLGVGEHPYAKKETLGFQAKGMLKRSDFGVTGWSPVVGDVVALDIATELRKQ